MEGFLTWLRDRHVADVCAAGAEDAELVRLDSSVDLPHAIEIRYRFASREAFQRYERGDAARLRAEGLEVLTRLGLAPGRGIVMTRTTGETIDWKR
jgi:hypothetical protein